MGKCSLNTSKQVENEGPFNDKALENGGLQPTWIPEAERQQQGDNKVKLMCNCGQGGLIYRVIWEERGGLHLHNVPFPHIN